MRLALYLQIVWLLAAVNLAQAQQAVHPKDIAPKNPLMEGYASVPASVDEDGFVFDLSGDLARMDIRAIAKGDYYLAQSKVDEAYRSYTIAYEAGNHDKYLLTQLGVVGVIRSDYSAAALYLSKAAEHILPTQLDVLIPPPYAYGYKTPAERSAKKIVSARNNRSVVFYLLYARTGGGDDAGTVATSRRFYNSLVRHDKELLCALSKAYTRLGKPNLALVEAKRAQALGE